MTRTDREAAIVDLDGTVYRGDRLVPGADDAIEALRERGLEVLFLTNKAFEDRSHHCEKLRRLGVSATHEDVVNSGWVTARYVADKFPDQTVFVIGEEPLLAELERAGVDVTVDSPGDVLVVSMDREFDYEKLELAQRTLETGGPFLATNPDRTCPMEDGSIPDAAGMIGAVEGVTARSVDTVLGKPSPVMIETALEALSVDPERCLIVGDRLETDIEMGNKAGMESVLVLSGATDRPAIAESSTAPDHVVDSLADLESVLE
ncbi:HAD-IIA family hydrolase [Natrialba sp. INN-245]|uniref:HAD-IIA family hydrolase n=1 Tax=Natrialba sp. INN-245 TaxID=2690967 RepID=UPI001312CEC8|nr:HAD-IIA family hydrolase [Natrialba sp. INN-245]MWV40392.1 HAD-IIA family hydrolase [Natrialba sp. INN-245]